MLINQGIYKSTSKITIFGKWNKINSNSLKRKKICSVV